MPIWTSLRLVCWNYFRILSFKFIINLGFVIFCLSTLITVTSLPPPPLSTRTPLRLVCRIGLIWQFYHSNLPSFLVLWVFKFHKKNQITVYIAVTSLPPPPPPPSTRTALRLVCRNNFRMLSSFLVLWLFKFNFCTKSFLTATLLYWNSLLLLRLLEHPSVSSVGNVSCGPDSGPPPPATLCQSHNHITRGENDKKGEKNLYLTKTTLKL